MEVVPLEKMEVAVGVERMAVEVEMEGKVEEVDQVNNILAIY